METSSLTFSKHHLNAIHLSIWKLFLCYMTINKIYEEAQKISQKYKLEAVNVSGVSVLYLVSLSVLKYSEISRKPRKRLYLKQKHKAT